MRSQSAVCFQTGRLPIKRRRPDDGNIHHRTRFDQAANEFIAAQRSNAERPEARAALGNFLAKRGQTADAEAEYSAALKLSPQYVTAAINLADLYRQLGRDGDGETILRTAIASSPRDAAAHHALGLTLTRLKRSGDALAELRKAAELEPDRSRYAYVYGVALHSTGSRDKAMAVLKEALRNHPNDRDVLSALVSFSRLADDAKAALAYAERLAVITPGDRNLLQLIEQLRRWATSAISES